MCVYYPLDRQDLKKGTPPRVSTLRFARRTLPLEILREGGECQGDVMHILAYNIERVNVVDCTKIEGGEERDQQINLQLVSMC